MENSVPQAIESAGENNNSNKRVAIIAVLCVALAVLALVTILGMGKKKGADTAVSPAVTNPTSRQVAVPTPTLIPYPSGGSYSLKTSDGQLRYPVNSTIKVILTANSQGKFIVGYDAVLRYSRSGFAYMKTTSLLTDYQIFAKDNHGSIGVSGVKALTSSTSGVMENVPLLEFEFTAAQKGSYSFVLRQKGSEANKLVDDKAQTTYPQTSKLQLEIY